MSSIDKYIADEVRRFNENVRVENSCGEIVGRIDGRVVFRFADRYGYYLRDSEKSKIANGILAYQRDKAELERRLEEERIRLEEERRRRLEEERRIARANASRAIEHKAREIEARLNVARNDRKAAPITLNKTAFGGFSTTELEKRIENVSKAREDAIANNEAICNNAKKELEQLRREFASCNETEKFNNLTGRVSSIQCNLNSNPSWREEFANLRGEMKAIETSVKTLNSALRELENMNCSAESKRKIDFEVSSAYAYDVSSPANVESLFSRIEKVVSDVKSYESVKAELDGVAEAFSQISSSLATGRSLSLYQSESTYEEKHYEDEIADALYEIETVFESIKSSKQTAYSTCSDELISVAERFVKENEKADDRETLMEARRILEDANHVLTADKLLSNAYENYVAKKNKIATEYGCDVSDQDVFDISNGEESIKAQYEALCKKHYDAEIENSKQVHALKLKIASDAMLDMGYELVKCEVNENDNEVARAAYFTKKGWNGVVMQIITSDEGIRRKLIGVTEKGHRTSSEQILKVARILEEENEPFNFMDEISKQNIYGDQELTFTHDVSSYTENYMEYIDNDVVLNLEGETVTVDDEEMSLSERLSRINGTASAVGTASIPCSARRKTVPSYRAVSEENHRSRRNAHNASRAAVKR